MTEIEIHDVALLKKLAKQAETLAQSCEHPVWRNAYRLIALGTNLLWRLIDMNKGGHLVDR